MPKTPENIAQRHCETGENPFWDSTREAVYWTDIPAGRLYKFDWRTRTTSTIYDGPPVGGFTQEADENLLLFRVHDIARLYPDGRVKPIIEFPSDGANRFNDVIADPEGRVFAGRLADSDELGGLYRIDLDGSIHKLFGGCATPNGMGFSPDLTTFYFTCSSSRTLYRFDYDRNTGEISDRRVLYRADEDEGIPDGLTVDREGNLWSARWGGSAVLKHAPDGTVLDQISLPVALVSSVAFGGPGLNTLLITTAGGDSTKQTEDGSLYSLSTTARGRLEFHSKILLE